MCLVTEMGYYGAVRNLTWPTDSSASASVCFRSWGVAVRLPMVSVTPTWKTQTQPTLKKKHLIPSRVLLATFHDQGLDGHGVA